MVGRVHSFHPHTTFPREAEDKQVQLRKEKKWRSE